MGRVSTGNIDDNHSNTNMTNGVTIAAIAVARCDLMQAKLAQGSSSEDCFYYEV